MVGAIIPIFLFVYFFLFFLCLSIVVLFLFFDDQDDLCSQEALICRFYFSKGLGLEFLLRNRIFLFLLSEPIRFCDNSGNHKKYLLLAFLIDFIIM